MRLSVRPECVHEISRVSSPTLYGTISAKSVPRPRCVSILSQAVRVRIFLDLKRIYRSIIMGSGKMLHASRSSTDQTRVSSGRGYHTSVYLRGDRQGSYMDTDDESSRFLVTLETCVGPHAREERGARWGYESTEDITDIGPMSSYLYCRASVFPATSRYERAEIICI